MYTPLAITNTIVARHPGRSTMGICKLNLAGVQQGTVVAPTAAALEALLSDGCVKAMPSNPDGSAGPRLFSSDGGSAADLVIMPIANEGVCTAAAHQPNMGSSFLATVDGKYALIA